MGKYKITVGMGSCGIAAGAKPVYDKLNKLIMEKNHPEITLEETGCVGMCYKEPLVEVIDTETGQKTLYGGVTPEKVEKIFTEHIENNSVIRDWVVKSSKKDGSEENLFDKQYRIVLSRTGIINPESIQDYLNSNGYEALKKVMNSMSQTDVIEE
ncbi:MAG TPA: NADH-quinone oxidoreductase subunit F, partial [Firmicutes bacterium]|nr:NADH-quinone oxidoreductase subunit F [Bacillota bacterium]